MSALIERQNCDRRGAVAGSPACVVKLSRQAWLEKRGGTSAGEVSPLRIHLDRDGPRRRGREAVRRTIEASGRRVGARRGGRQVGPVRPGRGPPARPNGRWCRASVEEIVDIDRYSRCPRVYTGVPSYNNKGQRQGSQSRQLRFGRTGLVIDYGLREHHRLGTDSERRGLRTGADTGRVDETGREFPIGRLPGRHLSSAWTGGPISTIQTVSFCLAGRESATSF